MEERRKRELNQIALTTDMIRQDFEHTLPNRVGRYLQVKPHGIIPNATFAAPSYECSLLFRDGHFYACIALVQAVAEATARYMCDINFKNHSRVFEKNVEKLHTRKFIDDKLRESLLKIWEGRDDYHHLNLNVQSDIQNLENLSRGKVCLLVEAESQIFEFEIADNGSVRPKHSKYWKIRGDQVDVFLRLEP